MMPRWTNDHRILLYAPNVHTGGGFVLLQDLLAAWPADKQLVAWLDARAKDRVVIPQVNTKIEWIDATLASRARAETSLRATGVESDTILCFHGLPPLLKNKAKILIYQQNKNYLGNIPINQFPRRTRYRLRFEQAVCKIFRHRVDTYIVQTPSMERAVLNWYGRGEADVVVFPFMPPVAKNPNLEKKWDFVYVADGEAHKNHRTLVEAWINLAEAGFRPSLMLTLSDRDYSLHQWVEEKSVAHGLNIKNLGLLPHAEIMAVYHQAAALIFPSKNESLGLPLIEAHALNLPIIASELDFVRDVCDPVQTFDPESLVSISRAVQRFLGSAEPVLQPKTAKQFVDFLMPENLCEP